MVEHGKAAPADPTAAGVSEREAEVLALLGDQATHEEIAARLFISVRTVESHAKSLRQKLNLDSRRALLRYAASYRAAEEQRPRLRLRRLPEPLTTFVGRRHERTALADALAASRLLTAVGPAGVGKTRLALSVARDVAVRYADGACHVDLATTTDPAGIPQAVATALGVRGVNGRSMIDTLLSSLSDRVVLLLLDNAEHLAGPVAAAVERLLDGCPGIDVVATSRVRLMVPFERVYVVPGLGLPSTPGGADGDAVALFTTRAVAFGLPEPGAEDRARIAGICRTLDGMALGIELAAARAATLGLDGVERGIGDQLGMLTGGARAQSRHRSLKHAVGWSYRLLNPLDQRVLCRVATFVSPFPAAAAAAVAGYGDVAAAEVPPCLGRLVESSLLTTVGAAADGITRYRAWEGIRQYAIAQRTREDRDALIQHLRWCRAGVADLVATATSAMSAGGAAAEQWYDAVDGLTDEARSALSWSMDAGMPSAEGASLASALGGLLFRRGRLNEAQRRYEQAAEMAEDPGSAYDEYARAAQAAACAMSGEEALRLWQCAAAAAERSGRPAAQAVATARSAEVVERWQGMFAQLPEPATAQRLHLAAQALAGDDKRAQVTTAVAGLFVVADEAIAPERARDGIRLAHERSFPERAGHAIRLARELDDPLLETAALDAWTMYEVSYGTLGRAAAYSRRRLELLADLEMSPGVGIEWKDTLHVGVFTALGVGDLRAAREAVDRQVSLPFLREECGLADEDVLAPLALTGEWGTAVTVGERYRHDWERNGRPCGPGRGIAASAMLMVHRIRGDSAAVADWLDVVATIRGVPAAAALRGSAYGEVFDGMALLHCGAVAAARNVLETPGDSVWLTPIFRPWRSALLAEAAALARATDAPGLIAAARSDTAENPLAAALARRASALYHGDRATLTEAADALDRAGCGYQWARTMVFLGGVAAEIGRDALAAMGAAPMPR